jgi:hypothetical protein
MMRIRPDPDPQLLLFLLLFRPNDYQHDLDEVERSQPNAKHIWQTRTPCL